MTQEDVAECLKKVKDWLSVPENREKFIQKLKEVRKHGIDLEKSTIFPASKLKDQFTI